MNKNTPILSGAYITTLVFMVTTQNWFVLWVGMELNTLLFVALMSSNQSMKIESMLTYFLIQSLASMAMMLSMMDEEMKLSNYMFFPSLMFLTSTVLKLGSAPLHLWFISVSFFLENLLFMLMLSFQKLYPLYFLLQMKISFSLLLTSVIILNFMLGSTQNFSQNTFKMILILSSVSHMGWMLVSLKMTWFFQTFFMYYTLMLILFINMSHLHPTLLAPQKKNHVFLLLMAMGGVPPLLGFFPKLVMFSFFIANNMLLMMMIALIFSLLDLYIYTRLILTWLPKTFFKKKWNKTKNTNMWLLIVANMLILPLL